MLRKSAALLACWLATPGLAQAEEGSLPLRVTPPTRHVPESLPAAPPATKPQAEPKPTPKSPPAATSHQRGPAPRVPADTLPSGAAAAAPDEAARRGVAEGTPSDSNNGGADDPQLIELRAADAVLFPTQLRGIEPGWSWDLPQPASDSAITRGLPLRPLEVARGTELALADAEWLRSLTMPELPVRLDRRVVTYLKFYRDSPRGRTIAAIWAKKSGRYVAALKAELRRVGLPPDLVWLSMIESGHNPTITSPVGAMGLWQFMPHSARMYGLTVDRWVDERRDPARATAAAIQLLSDLHQRFGNWELAMAAYNMGYAGLSRSITKFNTNDYWTLSRLEGGIPWETTLYVPKIFALAIVMNNREAFGLGRIVPEPSVSFDTILVEPATDLVPLAKAAALSKEEFLALNASYLAERLPPAGPEARLYPVRVPVGRGPEVLAAARRGGTTRPETVRVRTGDDLGTLLLDYGGSEADWIRSNSLTKTERLEVGTLLFLPSSAKRKPDGSAPGPVVVSHALQPSAGHRQVFYEVRPGDELDLIAAAFGASARELAHWNSLDVDARLREGMTLQVLVPQAQDLSRVRHCEAGTGQVLVAGSPEFHEYFESLRGMRRVEVVVRAGDTLSTVGSRYGMSVGSMERVNRRSRSTQLVPGESLVVYTAKAAPASATDGGPGPLEPLAPPRPELLPGTASLSP